MALESNRHWRLTAPGGLAYEFIAAEDIGGPGSLIRPHYSNRYTSLTADHVDISGAPGAENLRPEVARWSMDSWTGGEGNLVFDTNDVTVFQSGQVNPRNPGYLTTPPGVTTGNIDAGVAPSEGFFVHSGGLLWYCAGAKTYSSSNGTTYTSRTTGVPGGSTIVGACGVGASLYLSFTDNPNSSAVGNAGQRVVTTGSNAAFVAVVGGSHNSWFGNNIAWVPGTGLIGGWNGIRLSLFDTTAVLPTTGNEVYSTGLLVWPTSAFTDMCTTDSSIVMLYSAAGSDTQVHEFVGGPNGVGTPIWGGTALAGFTGRIVCFVNGVLYLAGTYGNTAALWALDMSSKIPAFIGYFRQDDGTTLTPVSMSAGIGEEVLIGMAEGYVFSYRADLDCISELDHRAGATLTAVTTYLDKRIAAFTVGGGTVFSAWNTDKQAAQTSGSFIATMPVFNYNLPSEKHKILIGFELMCDPLTAGQSIKLEYQVNENGSWAQAGATYPTVGGVGTFLAVSSGTTSTTEFQRLRWRVTLTGAVRLKSVNTLMYNWNFDETTEIVVKLTDSPQNAMGVKEPMQASTDREFLRSLIKNRIVCQFVDGYNTKDSDKALVYTSVVLEDLEMLTYTGTEGVARLTLRNLTQT